MVQNFLYGVLNLHSDLNCLTKHGFSVVKEKLVCNIFYAVVGYLLRPSKLHSESVGEYVALAASTNECHRLVLSSERQCLIDKPGHILARTSSFHLCILLSSET